MGDVLAIIENIVVGSLMYFAYYVIISPTCKVIKLITGIDYDAR